MLKAGTLQQPNHNSIEEVFAGKCLESFVRSFSLKSYLQLESRQCKTKCMFWEFQIPCICLHQVSHISS